MQSSLAQLSVLIEGRVQGVFLRRGIKTEAHRLGVFGEVRNLDNGTVQLIAEGERKKLEQLLDWCYRGTILAKVESLKFTWARASGFFNDFQVVRAGTFVEDKLTALKNLSGNILSLGAVNLPRHVAIIPDGNRRWAKTHSLAAFRGHEKGISNFTSILEESLRLKIPYLTAWGFSTENWDRGKTEVSFLMDIFRKYLVRLQEKLYENKVSFRHFGRKDRLPKDIIAKISELEDRTKAYSDSHFGLALDYGGRDEIIRAIGKCKMEYGNVTEENFQKSLDTHDFPDPDLIIRTSGEQRTSGLMPWQGTYAELYFTELFFPDFDALEFRKAVAEYGTRKRNFGG